MSDAMAILEGFNQEWGETQASNDWLPPDGEYVVQVPKPKSGAKKDEKTGTTFPWWSLDGKILQGAGNIGKSFNIGVFSFKQMWKVKGFCQTITGQEIKLATEGGQVLQACENAVFKVRVDNDQQYDKVKVVQVIQADWIQPVAAPTQPVASVTGLPGLTAPPA